MQRQVSQNKHGGTDALLAAIAQLVREGSGFGSKKAGHA
jgi:hypothetical protein